MKNLKLHIAVTVAAIVLVVALFSFAPAGSGQSQSMARPQNSIRPSASPIVSAVGSVTESAGPKAGAPFDSPIVANANTSSASPALTAAAARNAMLRNELVWTFGGKQQRGWYLYDLLIRQTLNTLGDPDTADFAAALTRWQQRMGLRPSGVLDEDTFMKMVSYWQSTRLKNRTPAQPDHLLTAPSSDFWDPARLVELRQLERNTYAAYKKMLAAAMADPTLRLSRKAGELAPEEKYFKIISSFRSREYQEKLRRESPSAGSAGLAINSPHFTGRALDIYVGGDPVDTRDSNRAIQVNTAAYQWLVRNAERFGFRPYFYEPWHWEYVGD